MTTQADLTVNYFAELGHIYVQTEDTTLVLTRKMARQLIERLQAELDKPVEEPEPGAWKQARGITGWKEGDEPARMSDMRRFWFRFKGRLLQGLDQLHERRD